VAYDHPKHGPSREVRRQHLAAVEHTGASPGDGEGEEQHRIGGIDRNRAGHLAEHAEQRDRACPHQVRAAPPDDGANLRILEPREQQQQSEHHFHVDRDDKERVHVEIHRAASE